MPTVYRWFILAVFLLWLPACAAAPVVFNGSVQPESAPAPDILLTDDNGQPFQLSALKGDVVLISFGYTFCPDVCPTTLSEWKQVRDAIGEEAQNIHFVFVTVDPERDTPEQLHNYMGHFGERFIGLTGTPEELAPVYESYFVQYERTEVPESAAGYLMSHSAGTYVIDTAGNWRLRFPFGMPREEMQADIEQLLRERL